MTDGSGRPMYAEITDLKEGRRARAELFAHQVLSTVSPWLRRPPESLDVLDLGCGYGGTALALSKQCRSVTGMEPMPELFAAARELTRGTGNFSVVNTGVEELADEEAYDLVVLDNVYEHLPDHDLALAKIARALRPGGVLFLLAPNRLWPLEVHYRLPFLSWLPLPLANRYLRWTGRGTDYTDASYAPFAWELKRSLRNQPTLSWAFTLPGDPSATHAGTPFHYRIGMVMIRRVPALWHLSKSLLVVAQKSGGN